MYPDWVEKYKTAGTTVKKIGANYYLYYATSRKEPGKKYPVSIQTYIGKITPDGVVSERVMVDVSRLEAKRLRCLIPDVSDKYDDVIAVYVKKSWYYTQLDKKTKEELEEDGLYDNGKVVL